MLCAGQLSADHTCPRATTSPPIGPDGRRCVAWRESEEDNLQSDHKPLLWNIKCADSQRNLSYENHFTSSLMLTELNETLLLIKVSQSKLFWWFTSDLMNHVKQKLKSGVSDTWMYYSYMSFYQYTDTNWNTFLWDWICQQTNQTQTFSSAVETLNFQLVFFWKTFLFFLFVSSTETQPHMLTVRAALSWHSDLWWL